MERLYRVRTPEMVDFSYPVAGLASRFLAWLLDAFVIAAIGLGGTFLLCSLAVFASVVTPAAPAFLLAVGIFLFFGLQWGYFVYWEAVHDGRTPGKRMLGLRTIGVSGVRVTLAQTGIRNLFRALDGLPVPGAAFGPGTYTLGVLSHALSPSGQRIGDRVAGTLVIREEKREVPKRIGFPEAKYNSFLEDPVLAQRISRVVRAEEREVLLELLLRRDELELATRSELFQKLAKHFAEKLDLPNARFLSDEKIVLNVAQAVVEGERRRVLLETGEAPAPRAAV